MSISRYLYIGVNTQVSRGVQRMSKRCPEGSRCLFRGIYTQVSTDVKGHLSRADCVEVSIQRRIVVLKRCPELSKKCPEVSMESTDVQRCQELSVWISKHRGV